MNDKNQTTDDVLHWALAQTTESDREKDGYVRLADACSRYAGDTDALVAWLREAVADVYGHVYEQEVYHVALRGIVNG